MKSWNFEITVMFGKCDGGESEIDCNVTDDEYVILKIAKDLGYDFEDVDDSFLSILKTFDLKKYEDEGINLESLDITMDHIKKIDFDKIDFSSLEDRIYDEAYDQERELYEENFSDDEDDWNDEGDEDEEYDDEGEDDWDDEDDEYDDFDSFELRVHI